MSSPPQTPCRPSTVPVYRVGLNQRNSYDNTMGMKDESFRKSANSETEASGKPDIVKQHKQQRSLLVERMREAAKARAATKATAEEKEEEEDDQQGRSLFARTTSAFAEDRRRRAEKDPGKGFTKEEQSSRPDAEKKSARSQGGGMPFVPSRESPVHATPGAFNSRSALFLMEDSTARSSATGTTATSTSATRGLAVALRVSDKSLPNAEFMAEHSRRIQEEAARSVQEKRRRNVILAAVSVAVLILFVASVVMFVMAAQRENNEHSKFETSGASSSLSPTSSPSSSSLESRILSLLPKGTADAIVREQEEEESYRTRAFSWMVQDLRHNPLLSDRRTVQRFGLAALYYATGGETWRNRNQWLHHNASECDWENGKEFASRSLIGKILVPGYLSEFFVDEPEPMSHCNAVTGLYEHLWLDQNNLVGELPPEMFLVSTLRTLSLGGHAHNQLEGGLPSLVGRLENLEGLVLTYAKRGGSIPSQIGLLTHLKGLVLSANEHTGTVPTQLGGLTDLQSLVFTGVQSYLEGPIPAIKNFPKLRWFMLHGGNDFTGTIPTQIGRIKTLELYSAGNNNLEGTVPSQVGLLSNLALFSINHNRVEGTLPTQLGLLTSSTLLNVQANLFSGTIPSQFGRLTNLSVKLNVQDNQMLTGTLPTQLGLLSNLYRLAVSDNGHSGPIPSQLGMLSSLGEGWLGGNSFSGTIPETLGALRPSLYSFDVGNNPSLSGTIPAPVCAMNGTCTRHGLREPCIESVSLKFDCTQSLCGCDCGCPSNDNNNTVRLLLRHR